MPCMQCEVGGMPTKGVREVACGMCLLLVDCVYWLLNVSNACGMCLHLGRSLRSTLGWGKSLADLGFAHFWGVDFCFLVDFGFSSSVQV